MSVKATKNSPSDDAALRERNPPANASVAVEVSPRAAVRRLFRNGPTGSLSNFLLRRGNFDESILAAIVGHWEILNIMRRPQLRVLTREHPKLVYRPFRGYLATCFRKKQRRQILREHYLYLTNRLSESFFSQIARDKPRLWQEPIGQDTFAIVVSFPGEHHYEGDLLLEFQINGVALYHLSFTIAPGYLVGSATAQATLIARIQGVRGQFATIRHATKTSLDIAPPHILMAAMQGIARALNVTCMAGVRNREQIMANLQPVPKAYFDYDAFWRILSAIEAKNFWLMPVPLVERPIEQIDVVHRRRTRLKRQFKYEVQETIRSNFIDAFFDRN